MGYSFPSAVAVRNRPPRNFSVPRKRVARRVRLQGLGHRYYSANLARWITKDPLGETGGLNPYGFVRNNAISLYDVLGEYYGDVLTGIPVQGFLDSKSLQSVVAPDSSGMRLVGPNVLFNQVKVYCPDTAGTSLQNEIGTLSISMAADVDRKSSVPGTQLAVLDRHLGVYIDVTFRVTNQKNLNDCCHSSAESVDEFRFG
jgi:RHS repeat-associated protein